MMKTEPKSAAMEGIFAKAPYRNDSSAREDFTELAQVGPKPRPPPLEFEASFAQLGQHNCAFPAFDKSAGSQTFNASGGAKFCTSNGLLQQQYQHPQQQHVDHHSDNEQQTCPMENDPFQCDDMSQRPAFSTQVQAGPENSDCPNFAAMDPQTLCDYFGALQSKLVDLRKQQSEIRARMDTARPAMESLVRRMRTGRLNYGEDQYFTIGKVFQRAPVNQKSVKLKISQMLQRLQVPNKSAEEFAGECVEEIFVSTQTGEALVLRQSRKKRKVN
jgi:hypothetical protein